MTIKQTARRALAPLFLLASLSSTAYAADPQQTTMDFQSLKFGQMISDQDLLRISKEENLVPLAKGSRSIDPQSPEGLMALFMGEPLLSKHLFLRNDETQKWIHVTPNENGHYKIRDIGDTYSIDKTQGLNARLAKYETELPSVCSHLDAKYSEHSKILFEGLNSKNEIVYILTPKEYGENYKVKNLWAMVKSTAKECSYNLSGNDLKVKTPGYLSQKGASVKHRYAPI